MEQKSEIHPTVDWVSLKERMHRIELSLRAEREPTAEQTRLRLQQRAVQLAEQPASEVEEETLELLVFELSDELYAVEARYVEAVVPLQQLTPVPCTPDFVLGVMSVRGRIRSILDLRRFFDLPITGLSDRNSAVMLSGEGMEFCLLTDRIKGTHSIPVSQLQAPLSNLAGIRMDYLLGVTAKHWAVLDAIKLLQDSRLVVNDLI